MVERVYRGVDSQEAVVVASEVHGLDVPVALGQINQPALGVALELRVDADREVRDAAGEAVEDALDNRRGRTGAVAGREGERAERLPAVLPGAGEHGGADDVAEVEPGEDAVVDQGVREGRQQVRRRRRRRVGGAPCAPKLLSLSLSCLEKLKRDSQQPTVFVV
jgi:hypothetical protein